MDTEPDRVHWGEARRVVITARLRVPIASSAEWPWMLDGMLEHAWWRSHPDESQAAKELYRTPIPRDGSPIKRPPIPRLPLTRLHRKGVGNAWSWAATRGVVLNGTRWISFLTQRARADRIHAWTGGGPSNVLTTAGRYKSLRKPIEATVGSAVAWQAIGDPERLESALRQIKNVGRLRGHGWGEVPGEDAWSVTDLGPAGGSKEACDSSTEWLLWSMPTIARPMSARWRGHVGIPVGASTCSVPYRPHYRRSGYQSVAPWTTHDGLTR